MAELKKNIFYYIGWLSVLNLLFWLVLIFTKMRHKDKPFFNTQILIYFGYINTAIIIFLIGKEILT